MATTNDHEVNHREWLLTQADRDGALGDLAVAAKTDPEFPRRSSPDDVRKRLNQMEADGDMHVFVDDAHTDWLVL